MPVAKRFCPPVDAAVWDTSPAVIWVFVNELDPQNVVVKRTDLPSSLPCLSEGFTGKAEWIWTTWAYFSSWKHRVRTCC